MRSAVPFRPGLAPFEASALLSVIPGAWRGRVAKEYAIKRTRGERAPGVGADRFDGIYQADDWLSSLSGRMAEIRIPLTITDSELCELARRCAKECMGLAFAPGTVTDTGALRAKMAEYVRRYGIEPPAQSVCTVTGEIKGVTDRGAIRRMGDDLWWRRRLRVAQGRAIEREAIRLGYVQRNREIYASTVTVERRSQQKRRNKAALENTAATNQHGDEFTLAELAARAVSNPVIRRGELMTRIRGFESVAVGLGHVGMFFTVTVPSRMHPKKSAGEAVVSNPKYDGTTPREAQGYLSGMWAKCRAALARAGAAVYGFRIAEPHHDGTPHWHLLLFMAQAVKDRVCEIFARYARQENPEEMTSEAAREARFKVVEIDPARGTAAGYIAKYVAKNIDGGGYQVQGDIEGGDAGAVTPSHRVEAWASTWGIRQFQQIGGAPVGVWRELRRLKADAAHSETLEAARIAADVGEWARYTEVMGGAVLPRKGRPLSVAAAPKGQRFDVELGIAWPVPFFDAAPLNRYGEEAAGRVWGVLDCITGRAFVTRVYRWEVKRKGVALSPAKSGKRAHARPITAGQTVASFAFDFARLAGPWTRVNNCTEGVIDGAGNSGVRTEKEGGQGDFLAVGLGDTGAGEGVNRGNGGATGRYVAGRGGPSGSAGEGGA
jgi:hypothetical protein